PPHPSKGRQPPPGPAQPVQGEVHRHPADPLLGYGKLTHLPPASRRPGEGLLDRILGIAEVTGDQIQLTHQATKGALEKPVKSIIRRHASLTSDGPHRFARRDDRVRHSHRSPPPPR